MNPVIQASDLTKVFGSSTAVDHISFDVLEGEIFGFLGPNGAGKTTTSLFLTYMNLKKVFSGLTRSRQP